MKTGFLLTLLLAPLFSAAAFAVEIYSLHGYMPDARTLAHGGHHDR